MATPRKRTPAKSRQSKKAVVETSVDLYIKRKEAEAKKAKPETQEKLLPKNAKRTSSGAVIVNH